MEGLYKISRRTAEGAIVRGTLSETMEDWREEERWLFLSPHDDDLAISGGLLLAAAAAEGVRIRARIVTDGRMGYTSACGPENIVDVRKRETAESFRLLGVEDFDWYAFPDAQLFLHQGRRPSVTGDPHSVGGYSGIQNSITSELRSFRPTRVFVLSSADYHPDHKLVNQEFLMSMFHAAGDIWPELGKPLEEDPKVYELAGYCPFNGDPDIEVRTGDRLFDLKLESIAVYRSQKQITRLVDSIREGGAVEYVRRLPMTYYSASDYTGLFG